MKSASAKQVPGHHRCLYLSATGRKCRSWVLDPRAMFCPRHTQAQPNGADDFSLQLLQHSCNFQNAEGIHDSLRHLYILLASDAILPRRAAVLGYLTSLLLRTLPAAHNDPVPPGRHSHVRRPVGRTRKSQIGPLPRPSPPHHLPRNPPPPRKSRPLGRWHVHRSQLLDNIPAHAEASAYQ